MRNAFSDALLAAALSDPKVLLLTGDHGYALLDAFRKARPEQYINCGIAEQNMVGVAAGLAKAMGKCDTLIAYLEKSPA